MDLLCNCLFCSLPLGLHLCKWWINHINPQVSTAQCETCTVCGIPENMDFSQRIILQALAPKENIQYHLGNQGRYIHYRIETPVYIHVTWIPFTSHSRVGSICGWQQVQRQHVRYDYRTWPSGSHRSWSVVQWKSHEMGQRQCTHMIQQLVWGDLLPIRSEMTCSSCMIRLQQRWKEFRESWISNTPQLIWTKKCTNALA